MSNRRIVLLATGLISAGGLFLSLSACTGNDALGWTEDVQLPDGRVVTVRRHQEFKGPHEIGDTPTESDYWLEFGNPDTGEKVRWESDRDLAVLVLMVEQTTPWLLTVPRFGGDHRKNIPRPPYLLFRYSGQWEPRPLKEMPVKQVVLNMTYAVKDDRERIEKSGRHLSRDQTHARPYMGHESYVIDFENVPEQTFGLDSVGKAADYLIKDKAVVVK